MKDPRPSFMWWLVIAMLMAVIVMMSGCSSISRQEVAWQTLHAVDVAQTLSIARDPCYRESNALTSQLIGEQPSTGEVVAWGVGSALLHAGVSHLLDKHEAPRWIRIGWDAITIGAVTHTVVNNHQEGVRLFGDNVTPGPGKLMDPDRYPGCTL